MSRLFSRSYTRRAFLKFIGLSGIAVVLEACGVSTPTPTPQPTVAATPTPSPHADATAHAFFDAWGKGDYAAMYQYLTPESQAAITRDDFVARYQSMIAEATATVTRPSITSLVEEGSTATVQFKTHYETVIFGVMEEDNVLAMLRENGRWGLTWSPALILKALDTGNTLKLVPAKSTRGNIYDRNGAPLAVGTISVLVSVWPAEMRRNQAEAQVLAALSAMLNLSQYDLQRKYANANPEWKVPIATVSSDVAQANADTLALPGVVTEPQDARAYPQGSAAAHVVGYGGEITADELAQVYVEGYREGDFLGRTGLEKYGEKYLAGARGGKLVVLSAAGQIVATLKEKPAQQSQSIYSTLDLDLQKAVETILGTQRGSLIVMNVKSGEILAMSSHPTYDPNAFVDSTRQQERQDILTSPQHVLLNRAAQGAYPQGSVEKVVTEAAALERGGLGQFTPFT